MREMIMYEDGRRSPRTARALRIMVLLLLAVICIFGSRRPVQAASGSIKLNKTSATLYVGAKKTSQKSCTLVPTLKNLTGTVKYKSSNAKVASVNAKGVVTAVGKGTAYITAYVGKVTAKCRVTVKNCSLKIRTGETMVLKKGAWGRINVQTTPSNSKIYFYSWDNKIASVRSTGIIHAIRQGRTQISVKSNGIVKRVTVIVTSPTTPDSSRTYSWRSSWPYASYSKIHTGKVRFYKAPQSRGIVVAVNAGHGTLGGESYYTQSHPDGTPKLVGGTTSAGSYYSISVSSGTVLLDGTSEADANLALARILKQKLLAAGYDVLMIRESGNVQLDNIARTVFANRFADCHIALHYDSSEYDAGFFYIGVPDIASYKSMVPVSGCWREHERLGQCLVSGARDKGVKISGDGRMAIDLTQTSYSTIPSVDLEVGDCASDHSSAAQSRIADGILLGIQRFFS